jgi:hypothetical protein
VVEAVKRTDRQHLSDVEDPVARRVRIVPEPLNMIVGLGLLVPQHHYEISLSPLPGRALPVSGMANRSLFFPHRQGLPPPVQTLAAGK